MGSSIFPIVTRPFEKIFFAKAEVPLDEIGKATGGYALVPHGLGMTVSDNIIDIVPDGNRKDFVIINNGNGSRMVTDTLEYVGIGYRSLDVIPQMEELGNFRIQDELEPVMCFKV